MPLTSTGGFLPSWAAVLTSLLLLHFRNRKPTMTVNIFWMFPALEKSVVVQRTSSLCAKSRAPPILFRGLRIPSPPRLIRISHLWCRVAKFFSTVHTSIKSNQGSVFERGNSFSRFRPRLGPRKRRPAGWNWATNQLRRIIIRAQCRCCQPASLRC